MSSLEVRAALLPAAQVPLIKGKSSAAGPRRAALGEITNSNAANAKWATSSASSLVRVFRSPVLDPPGPPGGLMEQSSLEVASLTLCSSFQRAGPSKSKPACAQKVKPVQVVVPTVQVGPAEPPPAVPEAPPAVPEEGALCRGFSQVLLAAPDVDEQDADQPQLCSQYVKEIYQYLHVLEVPGRPPQLPPLLQLPHRASVLAAPVVLMLEADPSAQQETAQREKNIKSPYPKSDSGAEIPLLGQTAHLEADVRLRWTYAPPSTCTELHLSGKFLSLIRGQSELRSSRRPAKFLCSKRVT
ncbi:unnamed protein product [Menidia menidia]|uniref:(Atlantic silverside) hypothetical protein n=1 Tax=Menidia menidia TaxID=238744 RepID=A0A8S4A9G4_9TELE|nr:unnamed protein product [Menidia menidia]